MTERFHRCLYEMMLHLFISTVTVRWWWGVWTVPYDVSQFHALYWFVLCWLYSVKTQSDQNNRHKLTLTLPKVSRASRLVYTAVRSFCCLCVLHWAVSMTGLDRKQLKPVCKWHAYYIIVSQLSEYSPQIKERSYCRWLALTCLVCVVLFVGAVRVLHRPVNKSCPRCLSVRGLTLLYGSFITIRIYHAPAKKTSSLFCSNGSAAEVSVGKVAWHLNIKGHLQS